jgi:hypothetical protein
MAVIQGTVRDDGGGVYNVMNTSFAGGAVGDGTTNDTAAFQAAINAAQPGGTVLVPKPPVQFQIFGTLDFTGKTGISFVGAGLGASAIWYLGTGGKAAVSLVGAKSINLRNLDIYCANASAPPMCAIVLGRTDAGSYGGHVIEDTTAGGYVTKAVLYNVASEENAYRSCYFHVDGGGAKYNVALSEQDDLGVSGTGFPLYASTCLCNWFQNLRAIRSSDAGIDADAALVYVVGRYSTGDLAIRDSFLSTNSGSGIQLHLPDANLQPRQMIVDGFRLENSGAWNGSQLYGVRVTGVTGASLTGLDVRRMSASVLAQGGYGVYGADGITFWDSTFQGSLALRWTSSSAAGGAPSSIWQGSGVVNEGQAMTFRQASTYLSYEQPTLRSADLFQVDASAATNETALLLSTNNAGTVALRRVSVGATNSGGTGFRVLRVPN